MSEGLKEQIIKELECDAWCSDYYISERFGINRKEAHDLLEELVKENKVEKMIELHHFYYYRGLK